MRLRWTVSVCALVAMSLILLLPSCTGGLEESRTAAHKVGFYAGESVTRTEMLSNGLSTAWVNGDVIAMWARTSSGTFALSGQDFILYGSDAGKGLFTSTLTSEMSQGQYTYYCCYPKPLSVSGLQATFMIPSTQDGKVSGGADIMIGSPVVHGPMTSVPEVQDHSGLRIRMNRMLHQFRFFVPDTDTVLEGEEIEKITVSFPRNVAGKATFNLAEPTESAILTSGTNMITLALDETLGVSSAQNIDYACLAFAPTVFPLGQKMNIRLYTATHIASVEPIDLCAREFLAGHSTPVALKLTGKEEYCRIRFRISANNLGENAKSIILTAPSGCVFGETGTSKYTYSPGYEMTTGESFEIVFEDIEAYRAFSKKNLTVTFDTEHVTTSQTLALPDMSQGHLTEVSASLPYLLYEDFSNVSTFSSNDNYTGDFVTGSFAAHSFLNGWTGARAGAEASKCIRIACRRETSANYSARVDSAPIIALKKSANVSVTFDYGMNNQYSDGLLSNPDVGQTFYVGYVTSTKAYKSEDSDGTFEDKNSYYFNEKTGSFDSTPNNDTYVLSNVPTGTVRISWRTVIEYNAGLTNTTCWLYIDNVKVQIAK